MAHSVALPLDLGSSAPWGYLVMPEDISVTAKGEEDATGIYLVGEGQQYC
jgi:hypothetical protein